MSALLLRMYFESYPHGASLRATGSVEAVLKVWENASCVALVLVHRRDALLHNTQEEHLLCLRRQVLDAGTTS